MIITRLLRSKTAKVLLFVLMGVGAGIGTVSPAHAAPQAELSEYSPALNASEEQGNRDNDNRTKHFMIMSNHGTVVKIDIGLYWQTGGEKQVDILHANSGNGSFCQIYRAGSYRLTSPYVYVDFDSDTGKKTYSIDGNAVCNKTEGNNKRNTGPNNTEFFGSYEVPASVVGTKEADRDKGSGLFRVSMTVRFADQRGYTENNLYVDGQHDQDITFQVRARGGNASNINTSLSRNNSIIGKFNGGRQLITQLLTFGLSCQSGNKSDQEVTVYDADNRKGMATPLAFYVVKVAKNASGGTTLTPLQREDYTKKASNGYIDFEYQEGKYYQGGAEIDTSRGYPVFIPGAYDDKGGYTTVKIADMHSLGKDPTAHYGLVVINLPSQGRLDGNNNFIGFRVPGDGIFGSSNFECPARAATVSPSISLTGAGGKTPVAPGEALTAVGTISNNSPNSATIASNRMQIWYTNSSGSAYGGPASGDQLVTNSTTGWPAATATPIAAGEDRDSPGYPTTAPTSGYSFVCARIDITGGPGTTPDPSYASTCVRIVYQPYMRVFGGDVKVGFGPAVKGAVEGCKNDDAGIVGWNLGAAGGFNGGGTQFGAQALDVITGFASAQRGGAGLAAATGLSFANSRNIGTDQYGGSFNNQEACHDYSDGITAPATSFNNGTGATPINDRVTKYVTGDVYIENNIFYSDAGNYGSLGNIPFFKLVVVGGNILIGSNVTQLDGAYVAQPKNGVGGNIYTCATPTGAVTGASTTYFRDCSKQLKINGSFVAKRVHLLRTFGNVSNSTGDTPGSSQAGEVFLYNPEQWLGQSGGSLGQPDAITSLPPSL